MAVNEILSVGIDIGTSTTQTVFSKIKMQNTAGYFAVPKISIIEKETVYKGEIHRTPMIDSKTIDSDKVKELVQKDFELSGYTTKDTATGAVIITGESSRKENASAVLDRLSNFAGEFVVSTAGPDLESIIAGKGSGAFEYSLENYTTAINMDIGGGTTNIVLFDKGEVVTKGCLDIGGRQITFDESGNIAYVSESAEKIAKNLGISIAVGKPSDNSKIDRVCQKMAELLFDEISDNKSELLDSIVTKGSGLYDADIKPEAIFFSGGVADCVYNEKGDDFLYGDIGVLLGRAIRGSKLMTDYQVSEGVETIRATVVGAGSYTTSVSGSTIFYNKEILPIKNVPVLKLAEKEYLSAVDGDSTLVEEKINWFQKETDSTNMILALTGDKNMSYDKLKMLSASIARAVNNTYEQTAPLLIAVENDMAKVFGQTVFRQLAPKKSIISIDGVKLSDGDYVDLGNPMMDGLVIPIIVKTLIFG